MAKKKAGKVIQMLSPENYIRTKARTLPIYECLVNAEWQQEGFANILIARSHTNGNLTVCFYLVDLFCLGVKNTHYLFNISEFEYQDMRSGTGDIETVPISYSLAHNIIYAGLEYAEELGFKPHKDFTSITRFMLEEDTEEVELIDIECGKDGKPLYVSGPFDDGAKINAVIKQLEKTAGVGNFDYLALADDEFGQDKEDEDDLLEDEFEGYTFEEKKQLFMDLESRKDALNAEDGLSLINISDSIFEDITDSELFDKYYAEYSDDLNIEIADQEISDEILGVLPGSAIIKDETRNLFLKIYNESAEDTIRANRLLEKFKKQTPDIPASSFLELLILQKEVSSKYAEKLEEYAKKFPDYPLIRILSLTEFFSSNIDTSEYLGPTISLHSIFPGRTELTILELIHYVVFNLSVLSQLGDPSRLEAFIYTCEELEFDDDDVEIFDTLFKFAKLHLVYNYLTQ